MAQYNVSFTVDDVRQASVEKKIAALYPDVSVEVEKIESNPSRATRLGEADSMVQTAKAIVEELRDEIQNWRDSLPDNLQDGDKASQLDDCISQLEDLESSLEGCDFAVEFPGMY